MVGTEFSLSISIEKVAGPKRLASKEGLFGGILEIGLLFEGFVGEFLTFITVVEELGSISSLKEVSVEAEVWIE